MSVPSNSSTYSNFLTAFTEIIDSFGNPLDLKEREAALRQNIITHVLNAFSNKFFPDASIASETAALLESLTFSSGSDRPTLFSQVSSVFGSIVGLPEEAAAFTTVSTSGQRIDNGRNFSASAARKWNRPDGKSDGRGATVVTFAFANDFNVKGISTPQAKTLFQSALQTWANYAPLDFVEVADPGAGDRVDIYVETDSIDGPSGTLAFAFFPENGDITFDADENWSADRFLETSVHELGHSLGLDHEDDTQAIMNSVLANRFSGSAFLLQDDINGIRSLYGSGQGSVTALNNSQPQLPTAAPAPAPNLVRNGSFEDIPLAEGEYGVYSQIVGWSTISGVGLQVDKRGASLGSAADGSAWVELDTYRQNSTIGQNIDTLTGQRYRLSVDFSNGGRPESTTAIEVFWDGRKLDTLSGGGKGQWRNFDYEVTGGDRTVSTLAFRAIGPSDNIGGFIDNIIVTEAKQLISTEPQQLLGAASENTTHRDPISNEITNSIASRLQENDFLTGSTSSDFGLV